MTSALKYLRLVASFVATNVGRAARRVIAPAAAVPTAPINRPRAKIGRNAPCHCGATKVRVTTFGGVTALRELPVKFKHCHGAPPQRGLFAKLKELAFGAFPNHFGNYLGKREQRPTPRPLTPDERFARLWTAYQRA